MNPFIEQYNKHFTSPPKNILEIKVVTNIKQTNLLFSIIFFGIYPVTPTHKVNTTVCDHL
jgi:hypothetical protein